MSYNNYQKKSSFLDNYVKVDDLIKQMNEKYPEGRLVSEIIDISNDHVVFKTAFYENADTDVIKCTGHARQHKDDHNSWFEKCEQKSRGRCLRVLLGSEVTFEEMEDVPAEELAKAANNANNAAKTNNASEEADLTDPLPVVRTNEDKLSTNKVGADNNAVKTLQNIQKHVSGTDLLRLLNDALSESDLNPVKDLKSAKASLNNLAAADVIELNKVLMRKEMSYTK
jgi:hypothetical protein